MAISNLAVVSKDAIVSDGVEIGPFAIVEDGVKIGPGVKIWPYANICKGTTIDDNTQIHMGVPCDGHCRRKTT